MTSSERIAADRADEIDVIAVMRLLWGYKYLIGAVALVCALAAVVLALTATPIYRAEVIIDEVHDSSMGGSRLLSGPLGGLASLAGLSGIGNSAADQDNQAVLSSYRLAAEFIRRWKLVDELVSDSGDSQSPWFAVKRFREGVLAIDQDKTTGITTVAIEWPDSAIASRWANGYVALANELIRTRALNESGRNIKYLNEQLGRTSSIELQKVMYDLIESETKTQMLANGRAEYAFTVLDPAVAPEMRTRPRRALMVLTGTALGALLGVLLAFAHNLWRRYRDESRVA